MPKLIGTVAPIRRGSAGVIRIVDFRYLRFRLSTRGLNCARAGAASGTPFKPLPDEVEGTMREAGFLLRKWPRLQPRRGLN